MRGRNAIGVAVRGPDGQIFAASGAAQLPAASQPVRPRAVLPRHRPALRDARHRHALADALGLGPAAAGEGVADGPRHDRAHARSSRSRSRSGCSCCCRCSWPGATNAASRGGQIRRSSAPPRGPHPRRDLRRLPAARVSRSAEIQRVFQYHGAEHMTIHALEHEDPLDDRARPQATPPRIRAAAPSSWSSSSS